MRVSLNWLKDYVDIPMPPQDLAELLTMAGLEVEAVEVVGQAMQDILVARILTVKRHPDAERLFTCLVDAGKERLPVVCSAPNLLENALIPLALPGAVLPGGIRVQEGLIRGERSVGMLLAEDEMGLTDDHSGVMILPEHLKPGRSVFEEMPLEDRAFEISITPNRPDCTSVLGIAREIAALTGQRIRRPRIEIKECDTRIDDLTSVTILDHEGCPRYTAGMIMGVQLAQSPFWLRYRLHVSGVRSINNVVDVTNYVMLEVGQPLHAFDYDRLKGNRIVVRRAQDGEAFTSLDGQSRTLNREVLMICDGERAVALAGIMGGLNSEIFEGSRNVLLESAYFDPMTIRRGSKMLGLSTEASYRFERGVDREGVNVALKRALMVISQLAGGQTIGGIIDNYPGVRQQSTIDLRVDAANRFLGTSLSRETMSQYLRNLEMEVQDAPDNVIRVTPPPFRVDIEREVDLMEEVARLEGYDKIPVSYPAIRPSDTGYIPELVLRDQVREMMVGFGFTEIITYSFISPQSAEILGAEEKSLHRSFVRLMNPLTGDQSVMRTSLVPGLMATLMYNITYGEQDLKLFEWGKIFIDHEDRELPHEGLCLAGIMAGLSAPKAWYNTEKGSDFYDMKGIVEGLLTACGLTDCKFQRAEIPPWYIPDSSAAIFLSGSRLGIVGQVAPAVLERLDAKTPTAFLFELDIMSLLKRMPKGKIFQPLAKFPAVYRDISIVVHRRTESARAIEIIKEAGGGLIEWVRLIDLYEGEKVGSTEKSMNFRICYRSSEGTLDGKVVNQVHEGIILKLVEQTGGRLRDG